MKTVTREMISAAHKVTMEGNDIVLSHRLLERIYLAMDALANQKKTSGSPIVPMTGQDYADIYEQCADWDDFARAIERASRPCTCHPDDNPPVPCSRQYAKKAVEDEREQCAQLADAEATIEGIGQRIAAAIRARGNA